MTSDRPQFTVKIACPTCEQRGTIVWEENDGLLPGKWNGRRLVQISPGFHAEVGQDQPGDLLIVCDQCDQILGD